MRALFVLNAHAGAIQSEGASSLADRIVRLAEAAGMDATVDVVDGRKLPQRVRRALEEQPPYDMVVAGGGDGTVRCVAERLHGSSCALGVLPLGTLNHFAKELGMPQDLGEAIRVLGAGQRRLVDCGEVDGRIFLNNATIGLYPRIVLDRERQRRETGMPKYVAHALSVIKVLMRFPRYRLRLSGPGLAVTLKTPGVLVGNNVYRIDPAGLGRREAVDAGTLGVFILRSRNWFSVFMLALRALLGGLSRTNDFELRRMPSLQISGRSRRLKLALDGEVMTFRLPLSFRSLPGSLAVIAPAPGASVEPSRY